MIIERHNLVSDLPEYKEKIHELKMNNAHFAKLFKKYHDVDNEIIRIEEGVENSSDSYLEDKKKQRLAFKDEMYDMLKSVEV